MFEKQTDSGVSPVIGVILMVAVTVALVALVTVVVFDIGGDVSESPDATVELEQGDQSGNPVVNGTILTNENVDSFDLSVVTADTDTVSDVDLGSNVGDSATIGGTNLEEGDTVQVIAVMPDGSSEVLTTTEVE